MGLTAEIKARMTVRQTGANDFGGPDFNPTMEALLQITNGTGLNQADLTWFDERTIAASTNDDLDLAGGLTSSLGAVITNAELVALFIINAPILASAGPNVSNLTIGLGTNPFLGFLAGTLPTIGPIAPGGFLLIGCGATAGIGTAGPGASDVLRIANGAGGIAKVQVGIIGRTA